MDQEKIGKFIAACRKDNGLTQAVLAEKLGITDRAVSKWETGRSMPDASIMLELCEILKINVNELLAGEHIVMDNYREVAEANILELKRKEENSNKALLAVEVVLLIVCTAFLVVAVLAGKYAIVDDVWKIALIIMASIMMIAGIIICIAIEIKAGYYECPECGHKYVPEIKSYIWATHMGWTRKMKCPNCGKKCWQKKVYSK